MDAIDRSIVDGLQGGFPLTPRPFADAAQALGLTEGDLIARIGTLVETGVLSRFGPLWNAERLGGAVTLVAMAVPEERFEEVAAQVNAHPEVAHNYAREHRLNMWFVIAAADPARIPEVLSEIKAETGLDVHDFPKKTEFFLALRLAA